MPKKDEKVVKRKPIQEKHSNHSKRQKIEDHRNNNGSNSKANTKSNTKSNNKGNNKSKQELKRKDESKKKMVDPDVHRLAVRADHLLRVSNKQFIYEFDPMTLNTKMEGKRIGICGSSGSGKSRLLLELARYHCKSIPVWMIFNPSEPGNHMYGPHVENEAIIHDNDDPKILVEDLKGFKKRQMQRCKDWALPTDPVTYKHDPSAGLIMDDISEDTSISFLMIR